MRFRAMRPLGFTLIELLVVIAIIAILAAILFPVFSRARDQAKQSVCLLHLKEIGAAMLMYADDYSNHPPLHTSYYIPPYTGYYDALKKYVKKRFGSFVCPADPNGCVAWRYMHQEVYGYTNITGYGTWLNPWAPLDPHPYYWTLTEIVSQTKCPYMWDAWHDFVDSCSHQLEAGQPDDPRASNRWNDWCRISGRHGGGFNCLYFDGHSKWLSYKDPQYQVIRLPIYDLPWIEGCLTPRTYPR